MDTVTTVESYEKTPSGAHKITFLGGAVAGTFDDVIGALAEKLAGQADANPVGLVVEKRDGKAFVTKMYEITPPEELGGEPESDPAPPEAEALDDPDAAANPTGAAALTNSGSVDQSAAPTPDSCEAMIHDGEEIVESEQIRLCANAINIAHVMVNDLADKLDVVGLRHIVIPDIQEKLGEAATALREARQ